MKFIRQIIGIVFLTGLLAGTGSAVFAVDAPPVSEKTFPLTVTDGAGRTVKLATAPHRIISLSPAATDILVKVGADKELVGVTRYCAIPTADESHVKRLGGVLDPDYEGIVALNPDLIVVPLLTDKSMQDKLASLGLTFVELHPEGLAGVLADIRMAGSATGHGDEGEKAAASIESIRALVQARWKDVPLDPPPVCSSAWAMSALRRVPMWMMCSPPPVGAMFYPKARRLG